MTFFKRILISVFVSALFISCSSKAPFCVTVSGISDSSESNIRQKKSGNLTCYTFSESLKEQIENYYALNNNAAILVQLEVKKTAKENPYSQQFGFLYGEDFNFSDSLKSPLSARPLVSMNLADFSKQKFALLFSFSKDQPCPSGFFIRTKASFKILTCEVTPAATGFDFSKEIPLYAFSPAGGALVKDSKKVDFSGLSLCFPSHNTADSVLPSLCAGFAGEASDVRISFGGERFIFRNDSSSSRTIPLGAFKNPYSEFEITENQEAVVSVLVTASSQTLLENSAFYKKSPVRPLKTDPGLIMSWPQENWRGNDYELFVWDRFENVLFFDTLDYKVQDDFFRRLAYFVEKKGFKGRLLTDSELEGKHGYNGHDYRARDLARFFEKARVMNFPLNQKEKLLQEILEVNEIIIRDENGSFTEGSGAVISISRESPAYLRTTFVAHEGWHGIFFIDEEFRNTAASIFYTLEASDYKTLNFLIRYFQVTPSLNYDTSDDYLLKNEFMAYMLQRPVSECEQYYVNMASREHAQALIKEEADYIIASRAGGFTGAAQMFEDYVRDRWNLAAGRVWLISRL